LKLAHIHIQVNEDKHGTDHQIFNRNPISRKITHPQSLLK